MSLSFQSWWPLWASDWQMLVAWIKFRWPRSNSLICIINYYFANEILKSFFFYICNLFHYCLSNVTLCTNCFYYVFSQKIYLQWFSLNYILNLGGQSGPVESKIRWPGGQIRWPRANGPVLTTCLLSPNTPHPRTNMEDHQCRFVSYWKAFLCFK